MNGTAVPFRGVEAGASGMGRAAGNSGASGGTAAEAKVPERIGIPGEAEPEPARRTGHPRRPLPRDSWPILATIADSASLEVITLHEVQ